jgi:hypothetical protein
MLTKYWIRGKMPRTLAAIIVSTNQKEAQ